MISVEEKRAAAARLIRAAGGWFLRLWTGVALVSATPGVGSGQDNFRAHLFKEADDALILAKEANADVYAPTSFTRAMDAYVEAKDYFQRGRPIDEIRDRIRSAARYFGVATAASRPAAAMFAGTMSARSDALSANALRSSPELWNRAEALFRAAAVSLEEGDQRSARSDAGEAMGIYRAAELEAIKTNFLAPARQLLARADEMSVKSTAPQTLERARKLANLAEAMIQQNRYDNAEARRLAEEASYEAAHAIYLHQTILQLRTQGRDLEDAILLSETQMARIGTALGTHVHFDAGADPAVDQIIATSKARDSVITQLNDSLRAARTERESLRRRLALLESRPGAGVNSEADRLRKDEGRRKHDQTVALASILFTSDDGIVLREGNNVLIRIYGLQFDAGRSEIHPQSSGLLSKIQRAIRMFPNCQLTVEAHTESGGSEVANLRISESRAEAVAGAIRGALPASTPILSQGFGSSRPIADNSTPEGRARNRRIDFIVVPEWAIVGR